jgi:putative flippase GtrA
VLATIATLGLALAWQLATISHGGHSSLSDVPRVLQHRGIGPGAVPYLARVLEYPVGAGVLLYLATLIAPGPVGALVVTAIAASVAAVVVTVLLARRDGARVWRWALASPLLLFAFQNWDVFAVLALVAGLIAFERRRPATAGVLLGIGTAIKLFPIVAVPLLAASAWSHRERRSAVRVTVAALATVALANLPFALANPTGWWWTTSFQGARPATWGSAWLHLYDLLGLPTHGVAAAHLAKGGSLVALGAATVAPAGDTVRRRLPPGRGAAAAVALLLLTNKVYSPTYDLWLVPFFVMVPALSRRLWLSFCAVDLAIYAAVYGYLHHVVAPGPVHQVLPVLVSIRTVVLVVVIVRALRPVAARVRPVTAPQPHDSFVRTQLARPLVGRLARCMSVSVLTTVFSLVSLVVLTTFGMAAMLANVLTTTVATIPSYHLNRRWTWSKRGSSDPWREVVPFWLLAFAGLALSTVTVGIADRWAAGAHLDGVLRTGAVLGGHLGGFALLWVAQFVVLDRVLFRHRDARPPSGAYPAGVVD